MKNIFRIAGAVLVLTGIGMVAMWATSGGAPAQLAWDPPIVRKSLMSFGYKVYANPQVSDGRHFLSKVVLKNTGGQPVRDLAISYQIPDYVSWTTPEVTKQLEPGNSLVKVFYPKLPEKVSRLANQTTATLEIKLQWRETDGGPLKEEVLRDNFMLRGVNEIQYSDLPAEEIASWYDNWTLAPFVVCMVTPNDPVVKEYAAEITRRTGGSMAGVTRSPREVAELMKATYDYMIQSGMRYAGAKGVPEKIGDIRTTVQTVRLPRDVITSNNGLCIELAILWASIMDHLGCESYIVLRPGHAYTIVMAEGQSFPIECTAITPKAVGQEALVPFEKAVQMASEDLQQQQFKILYSVRQLQTDGYASPELPDFDLEKIKNILATRDRPATQPAPAFVQNPNPGRGFANPQPFDQGQAAPPPAPVAPAGTARYDHARGLMSFNYPQNWQSMQTWPAVGNTFNAGDPVSQLGVNVYEIPGAQSADAAMNMIVQTFAQNGLQAVVQDTRRQGDVTYFQGSTVTATGYVQWMGVFRAMPGGVIGVTAGGPPQSFEASRAQLSQLLNAVRFAP